jgi:hypothetical protein
VAAKLTEPGFHSVFDSKIFDEAELKIVNNLATGWLLTRSGMPYPKGHGNYKFILLKPTEDTKQAFNLERELLCVLRIGQTAKT